MCAVTRPSRRQSGSVFFFFLKTTSNEWAAEKHHTCGRSPFTPFSSATASTPARGEETNDEVICFSLSLPMQSRLCGYVGQRAAEWIIQGPVLPFKTSFIEFTESQVAPLPLCAPLLFYFKVGRRIDLGSGRKQPLLEAPSKSRPK